MRILVFEYITGGGFNNQELPASMASEGILMLQALLDDLREVMIHRCDPPISVLVMMDERIKDTINAQGFEQCIISQAQNTDDEFIRLMQQCDAVWPIAPESDGILQDLCAAVEATGKRLLTSPASAVRIAGNKFNTYQLLMQQGIATVPTQMYSDFEWDGHLQWVVETVIFYPNQKILSRCLQEKVVILFSLICKVKKPVYPVFLKKGEAGYCASIISILRLSISNIIW